MSSPEVFVRSLEQVVRWGAVRWALATAVLWTGTKVWGQEVEKRVAEEPTHAPSVCLLLPLSGPHAAIARRAERIIRDVLGPESVASRTLDSLDPGPVVQVARAKEAGCGLAIGGLGDRESRAMAEAAEAEKMPLLALGRAPDERPREYVIAVRTPRVESVAVVARHVVAVAGRDSAHIVVPNTPFGREVAREFRRAFEGAGGRILSERAVPSGEDPAKTAAVLATMRSGGEGPASEGTVPPVDVGREVLFLGFDLVLARRIVAWLEFQGVPVRSGGEASVQVVGTSLWNDPARVSRQGDDLDGALFADVWVAEGVQDVLDAEIRDAAFLAIALLKQANVGDPTAGDPGHADGNGRISVARWAEGLKFPGATGTLEVRGGRVVGRTITVFEIRRGQIRDVFARTDGNP